MTHKLKILAVDDEAAMRQVLRIRLQSWGYDVVLAADGEEARRLARTERPDAVVSDVVLPDVSGLELVETLTADAPERPVILITAYGNVDTAVEAMKKGARDFLTKPIDHAKLKAALEDALRALERQRETRRLESRLTESGPKTRILGESPPMRELLELVTVVAESDASALLTGESGTGKELLCRTLHELSSRRDGPFIAVNTAALPEGLTESELFGYEKGAFTGAVAAHPGFFEQAHRGTLFLDEIAEMPMTLQPKLLRVLEERRVRRLGSRVEKSFDVRVIAATNRDPQEAIAEGRLRSDLYYRLNVFTLELPPLRDRGDDIALLAQSFINHFNAKHGMGVDGLSSDALDRLRAFDWPGNVRELRNVVERAVIVAKRGWIELSHLPPYLRQDAAVEVGSQIVLPRNVTAAEAEKALILATLKQCDGNKAAAARQLGLDVKTIRNKLNAWQLDEDPG